MKIKICGITSAADARMAESLGADYVGIIFAKASPRCVDLPAAVAIAAGLATVRLVGVFVEQSVDEIERIVERVGLHAVQLYHPPERPPEGAVYILAIRVRDRSSLQAMESSVPDYFLTDAHHEQAMGGTGQTFEWSLLPRQLDKVFLSGGIDADNVRGARQLNPYAIDVCSGVESRPGIKDQGKLEQFFEEARA
ncbi:MAG: phosphoribosylanthranilate isomerase [Planctomycetota bacterium]|nr:phosphoribosylanthranilate isomerase [Planctomycetota bacterium]